MLSRFERPILEKAEEAASKKEIVASVWGYVEKLKFPLQERAKKLREKGFPVDDDCRIDPRKFLAFIAESEIQKDLHRVTGQEKQWLMENSLKKPPEQAHQNIIQKNGELLETVKTLGMNGSWFGGRFVTVRTSKFDDYFNGVDNLIFDTVTFQPIAAIDDTTNLLNKKDAIQKVQNGATVKYATEYTHAGAVKRTFKKLPVLLITSPIEEVATLAKDLINGSESEEGEIARRNIVANLKQQAEQIAKGIIPIRDPKLKDAYRKTSEILNSIK